MKIFLTVLKAHAVLFNSPSLGPLYGMYAILIWSYSSTKCNWLTMIVAATEKCRRLDMRISSHKYPKRRKMFSMRRISRYTKSYKQTKWSVVRHREPSNYWRDTPSWSNSESVMGNWAVWDHWTVRFRRRLWQHNNRKSGYDNRIMKHFYCSNTAHHITQLLPQFFEAVVSWLSNFEKWIFWLAFAFIWVDTAGLLPLGLLEVEGL